ncbi:exopolysaccharide biosynthesis polyprenyl glycosylphosphotransferase [Amycolatopsis bartoniae]|uniref:Exopolysaccharide biosynthesis polyprenyl glycosylphosphotransferase n=1 Tax=Amycolatopsis bartoniae TaxID=941986 RepID=A0A8H9M6R5_9PSEU|nr:sugar transferase [Amycolatopsis bartoniae]MBB2936602.1 exopolysaccharide biosynthesis polyprenyl glycosylphosphotransferase [Amycolatopsis bartoniae]TVT09811.1 sugar transferase [Amycolatopsis bartoniae]GHF67758.1 exopolysaccharide biosynthesis polyprenyl glycosylphosphotransferase [Amycolatopsis bartoniae]
MEDPVGKPFPEAGGVARVRLQPVPDVATETSAPRASATSWERRYSACVIGCDVFATVLVIVSAVLVLVEVTGRPYLLHASGTATAILCALPLNRAWSQHVLGEGAEEFRRLGRALLTAGVVVALAGLMFGALDVQPWVFFAVPVVGLVALPQRYLLRRFLHRARHVHGTCMLPVMAAGAPATVHDLIQRTRADAHVGWHVEAVCTDSGTGEVGGVAVAGRLDEVAEQVRRGGYRVVAVTSDPYWTPARLQRLAWDLEGTGAELVVAPVLMEVGGPRLNVSGVLGMPLLRVSAPAFTGGRRVVKEIFDRATAAAGLVLISPVLLLIALLIKFNDRGPVFYRQHRVGRDGHTFRMIKFRTMVVDADRVRNELLTANEGAGPLFKMRRDPRVTRVGAVLRRYSLDELPQLFNVLGGTMSLVGPRPPLPEETVSYERAARRRLLVKPGLTGLWQVSGRSDLSWDESVRLDLRYVEDWSLALDMVILWKTARAVVSGRGAY